MRSALIGLLVLALLAAAVFAVAVPAVDRQQDDVTLTETRRFGDPAAADGLTVSAETTVEGYLHWVTTLSLGAEPTWDTRFSYTGTRQSRSGEREPYLIVNAVSSFSSSTSGTFQRDDLDTMAYDGFGNVGDVIWDVADGVPAGQTTTVTVELSDYWEYLPIQIEAGSLPAPLPETPSEVGWWDLTFWPGADEFFRIPAQGVLAEITISKNDAGGVYEVQFSPINQPDLLMAEAFDGADGVYLAVAAAVWDEEQEVYIAWDIGVQPGIYYLPWKVTEDQYGNQWTVADAENIRLLRPLDLEREGYVGRMDLLRDGTRLLVQAGGQCHLLDTADFSTIQTFPAGVDGAWSLQQVEEDYVAFATDLPRTDADGVALLYPLWYLDHAVVWAVGADGQYHKAVDCSVAEADLRSNRQELFFDGTRLLMVQLADDYADPSFELAVCDGDGLQYAARFDNSQARDRGVGGERIYVEAGPTPGLRAG